jgi:hypothetical protein
MSNRRRPWRRYGDARTPYCAFGGKASYYSRRAAHAVAQVVPDHQTAYRCPWCGWWHLTKRRRER